jgi:threonine dehydratase
LASRQFIQPKRAESAAAGSDVGHKLCRETFDETRIRLDEFSFVHDSYQMKTLGEAIRPTTFIKSSKLNDHLGLDVTIASETFQHTGSFKFRAAYNLALNVEQDEILTASSGNFGQALAYACKLTGKKCTVVMPDNSANVKVDAVRKYGSTVDLIDTAKVGRGERVAQLAEQMPRAYIASAYDDKYVIEGNASLGDELADKDFDVVITAVGGGGLISGLITGFRRHNKASEIYGAEPLLGNDAARSLKAGKLIVNEMEPQTIADGARTISLGKLNWEIIKSGAAGIIEVDDETLANAMKVYFNLVNLKCEPTGALSLGALLVERERFIGRRICLIVSGGNVDPGVFARILAEPPTVAGG